MTLVAAQSQSCPVCAARLAEDQSWCLDCGAAARTRIAPTPPRWRLLAAVLVLAAVLAVAAIVIAIGRLT